MKFTRIAAAGLLTVSLLSACAPEYGTNVEQTTVTTDLSTETSALTTTIQSVIGDDNTPKPVVGGIGEKTERFDSMHGKTTLLSVSLSLPVANITGNDALQQTLTQRLDAIEAEIRAYVDALTEKYEADYDADREGLATPSLQVRFALNYFTSNAASLTYFYNETTSEGRTISYTRFCNVDLRVGSEILLSALLKENASDALLAKVKEAVKNTGTAGLYDGQTELIADLASSSWYMTRDKLVFCFSAGDLAPVSSGEITVSFGKEALADLLSNYGNSLIGSDQT